MRISDWSSDVCSSDLVYWAPVSPVSVKGRLDKSTLAMWSKIISVLKRSAWAWNLCIRSEPCTPWASAGQLSTSVEIGRASGRGRVCQDVEISVGAGSLKKTNKQKTDVIITT